MKKTPYIISIIVLCLAFIIAITCGTISYRNKARTDDETAETITAQLTEESESESVTEIETTPVSTSETIIIDHPPAETTEETTTGHKHTWYRKVIEPASCMHNGVGYRKCLECGEEETYILYRIAHDVTTTIKPDDYGHVINTTYCATCGTTYVEEMNYTTYIGEEDGITRQKMVSWLKSHENDEYYLGTVYKGHAYAFPNGAANYSSLSKAEQKAAVEAAALYVKANKNGMYYHKYGKPGVNCSGLIGHFMYAVAPSWINTFNKMITSRSYLGFSPSPSTTCQSVTNAWNWYILVTRNSISSHSQKYDDMGKYYCYKFPSREEMMSSGVLKKGDIVLAMPQYENDDMHLGLFWGDTSDEDIFWVSEKNGVELKDMHDPAKRAKVTYWYVMPLKDGKAVNPHIDETTTTAETDIPAESSTEAPEELPE